MIFSCLLALKELAMFVCGCFIVCMVAVFFYVAVIRETKAICV